MIKNISIFDLDGTIIDSSHRQMVKSDGTLDLAKWFENATAEKIFADKVLPLAQQVRKRQKLAILSWFALLEICKMQTLNFCKMRASVLTKLSQDQKAIWKPMAS